LNIKLWSLFISAFCALKEQELLQRRILSYH